MTEMSTDEGRREVHEYVDACIDAGQVPYADVHQEIRIERLFPEAQSLREITYPARHTGVILGIESACPLKAEFEPHSLGHGRRVQHRLEVLRIR